jgi:hypothetical protein
VGDLPLSQKVIATVCVPVANVSCTLPLTDPPPAPTCQVGVAAGAPSTVELAESVPVVNPVAEK